MDLEKRGGSMELFMKECTRMEEKVALESISGQMGVIMKEILNLTCFKDMEDINGQMEEMYNNRFKK